MLMKWWIYREAHEKNVSYFRDCFSSTLMLQCFFIYLAPAHKMSQVDLSQSGIENIVNMIWEGNNENLSKVKVAPCQISDYWRWRHTPLHCKRKIRIGIFVDNPKKNKISMTLNGKLTIPHQRFHYVIQSLLKCSRMMDDSCNIQVHY